MATLVKTLNLYIFPDVSMTSDGGLVGGSLYRIGYKTNLDTNYTIINNVGPVDLAGGVGTPASNTAVAPNTTGHNITANITLTYTSGPGVKPTTLSVYVQPMCISESDTLQRHAYTVASLSAIVWP
jgi:hypothetical protein